MATRCFHLQDWRCGKIAFIVIENYKILKYSRTILVRNTIECAPCFGKWCILVDWFAVHSGTKSRNFVHKINCCFASQKLSSRFIKIWRATRVDTTSFPALFPRRGVNLLLKKGNHEIPSNNLSPILPVASKICEKIGLQQFRSY